MVLDRPRYDNVGHGIRDDGPGSRAILFLFMRFLLGAAEAGIFLA